MNLLEITERKTGQNSVSKILEKLNIRDEDRVF